MSPLERGIFDLVTFFHFPQKGRQFVCNFAVQFAKVENKLESFIVVVVGGMKTVENWRVYYHCAENKRWIFQISP